MPLEQPATHFTQTQANPSKGRSRRAELEQDVTGKPVVSTFQASFQPHHTTRDAERSEYVKNKGRNGRGGDWWSQSEAKVFETHSCYTDSFPQHNYALLRATGGIDKKHGGGASGDDQKGFQKQWFNYRKRKPAKDDVGVHYDILTGREMGVAPPGVAGVRRGAGRVSIDKLNALKYGGEGGEHKRKLSYSLFWILALKFGCSYNIISNAPLAIVKD
ncbi:hypothetical protein HDU79_009073 [Rhizoclosmatium sp. JEL0117]|nr:hypothetical protein HDU79_009073 [Rhizoclosmatium sp. JEL0117]